MINKYLLLMTFETDNYSIRFEMKKTLSAQHYYSNLICQLV